MQVIVTDVEVVAERGVDPKANWPRRTFRRSTSHSEFSVNFRLTFDMCEFSFTDLDSQERCTEQPRQYLI